MKIKKEFLHLTAFTVLMLNLANTSKVEAPTVNKNENDTNSLQVKTEQVTTQKNKIETDSTMNERDVWDMKHKDSDNFVYVPLKAFKAEYNGIEYYYLHDNEGSFYIVFEELVDGGNYVGEVGKFSDTLYELEVGNFEFSEKYEQFYEEYSIMDSKVAEKMVKEILIDI